jgi:mRNA interferase ChpB
MERGDIWHMDLDPATGLEQQGKRFVFIVSPRKFNQVTQVSIVLPITSGGDFARSKGFAVSLSGAGTRSAGVVRCDQPRAVDLKARGGKRIERAPDFIIQEVMARLTTIFEQ